MWNRRKRRKAERELRESEEFIRLAAFFEEIASTILVWGGDLPRQCRSGWIERQLYYKGCLGYFHSDWKKEDYDGDFILPLAGQGQINAYGELYKYKFISPNRTFDRTFDNAVLIRNNELRLGTYDLIEGLIAELADIRITMRINRNSACKTPAIFHTNDKKQLSDLNLYEQIVGNKPIILMQRGEITDVTYGLGDQRAPYYGDKLREEYDRVLAEILTIIGVISNPVVKAERVNTIEASSNRGLIIDSIDSRLQYRKEACAEIKKMFNKNLTVEINNMYTRSMIEQGLQKLDGDPSDGESNGE